MGRGKRKADYNDFVDGEKLKDNAEPRQTLQNANDQESSPRKGASRQAQSRKCTSKPHTKKPPLTHFLCLPLVNVSSEAKLSASLARLRKDACGTPEGDANEKKKVAVPEKAIRPLGTLHLTLGVMSLDEEGMGEVGKIMGELDLNAVLSKVAASTSASFEPNKQMSTETTQDISNTSDISTAQPLTVSLRSLVSMHNPKASSVLYAIPEDPSNRLYAFALALRDVFKGVLVPDDRPLKLHATIINTIYARSRGRASRIGDARGNSKNEDDQEAENEAGSALNDSSEEGLDGIDQAAATVDLDTALETVEDVGMAEQHGSTPAPTSTSKPRHKKGRRDPLLRLDARQFTKSYEDFVWADDIQIEKVQVCRMGAKKILSESGEVLDQAYEEVFESGF